MSKAIINISFPLYMQLSGEEEDRYIRVIVLDGDNNVITTQDLIHQTSGYYLKKHTFTQAGSYVAKYFVFTDDQYSIRDVTYDIATELITVEQPNDYKADVSALSTEANATANKDEIITEVNENEIKIDALQAQNDLTSLGR